LELTEVWPTAKGLFGVGSWREFVGLGLAFRYYVHAEHDDVCVIRADSKVMVRI
jgi:hypothetical protein